MSPNLRFVFAQKWRSIRNFTSSAVSNGSAEWITPPRCAVIMGYIYAYTKLHPASGKSDINRKRAEDVKTVKELEERAAKLKKAREAREMKIPG